MSPDWNSGALFVLTEGFFCLVGSLNFSSVVDVFLEVCLSFHVEGESIIRPVVAFGEIRRVGFLFPARQPVAFRSLCSK